MAKLWVGYITALRLYVDGIPNSRVYEGVEGPPWCGRPAPGDDAVEIFLEEAMAPMVGFVVAAREKEVEARKKELEARKKKNEGAIDLSGLEEARKEDGDERMAYRRLMIRVLRWLEMEHEQGCEGFL